MVIYYLFIFLLGLIFGSFLTSFPYRLLAGESMPKGRSRCPLCTHQINWYDNIPLISYFFLKGKCRNCKKPIPWIYPLIEFLTAISFVFIFNTFLSCEALSSSPFCTISFSIGLFALPFFFFLVVSLFALFITDMEEQIIPDELSFLLFIVSFFVLVGSGTDAVYSSLLAGFLSALFLLLLHLGTLGRGMGLGDVKLALSLGLILGWPYVVVWLMGSFVLGAVIGVLLIAFGQAKFGKHIAFGPFLVLSFFIVFVFGDKLVSVLMPYL
jgi:prepilin signal peptidase PulO-like enzyme (type II secretory pathway)